MNDKETDFVAKARKRLEQHVSDEATLREEEELNLRFVAGDQWNEDVKAKRIKAGRPVLTFSRCHTFVQPVANEARQMRGEIKFVPAEDGDKDTAEVYEGLARHIQYNSSARVAYETAVDYSAGGSFGYYRFLPEYCDDNYKELSSSIFNQEIKVVTVPDPMQVYGVLIPSFFRQEPEDAFVVSDLTKEEYEAQFPDDEISDWDWAQNNSDGWVRKDKVRIAEYWYVERTPKTVYLLESGDVVDNLPDGVEAKDERVIQQKTIKFCKLNGVGKIKGSDTEWKGRRIPIFAVLGKGMVVGGKPRLFSVITFQRDPQQLINYYKTRIAETLGTAPIQPYLVAAGQTEGFEREWAELNTTMRPYLPYNPTDVAGRPVPPPVRQVFEAPIGALSEAAAQEIDDMKATAGMFDASLGAKGNETSGIAIQQRKQQADATNLHYIDNLERTFDESGRELACAIKYYYDTPRTVRILGDDEAPKIIKINQEYMDGDNVKNHRIGGDDVGKYDIIVTMNRSFSTKRMESFDQMGQVIQSAPDLLPMFGDIYFKNSDMAGADEIAERFKKMLPPNLQEPEEGKQPVPPEVQQAMGQMQQQIMELSQELNAADEQLKTQGVQAQSKENIEQAKLAQQVQIEAARVALEREKLAFEQMKFQATMNADMVKHSTSLDSQETQTLVKVEADMEKAGMQFDAQKEAAKANAASREIAE
jgi:hypothetical protein